jgi:Protein of unknown function (DUF2889)
VSQQLALSKTIGGTEMTKTRSEDSVEVTSPSEPAVERVPVHRRTITYESYDEGDSLCIVGTLKDERPWAAENKYPIAQEVAHDMDLRVVVDKKTMVITECQPTMRAYPHFECPSIYPAFEALVGVSVGRGFTMNVIEKVSGKAGCTHLDQLARALGPVVYQAMTACKVYSEAHDGVSLRTAPGSWIVDTCHLWAEGGIGSQKFAAGFRFGGDYPAPPLETIRARSQKNSEESA